MRKKDSSNAFAFQIDRKQKSQLDFNRSTEEGNVTKDKGEVENNFKGIKLIKNKSMAAKISDEGLNNV
jgi:hypothetical protein